MENKGLKLISMFEVRQKLGGRSRSAVYKDVEQGRLPRPMRFGGRLFWDESEVNAHLRELSNQQRGRA